MQGFIPASAIWKPLAGSTMDWTLNPLPRKHVSCRRATIQWLLIHAGSWILHVAVAEIRETSSTVGFLRAFPIATMCPMALLTQPFIQSISLWLDWLRFHFLSILHIAIFRCKFYMLPIWMHCSLHKPKGTISGQRKDELIGWLIYQGQFAQPLCSSEEE